MTLIALVTVLAQVFTPGTFEYAMVQAGQCETATSWAEQVAPGLWRAVCGDDEGNELVLSCYEHAFLLAGVAKSIDGNEDAAYEDAWQGCEEREGFGVFASTEAR